MTSKLVEERNTPEKFPCLMRYEKDNIDFVVLFQERNRGQVVWSNPKNNGVRPIGEYETGWIMASFKPLPPGTKIELFA